MLRECVVRNIALNSLSTRPTAFGHSVYGSLAFEATFLPNKLLDEQLLKVINLCDYNEPNFKMIEHKFTCEST